MGIFKNNGAVFLHPDEVVFSTRERKITTVLGSCVAVTMFCQDKKVGTICHSSLPLCPDLGLNLDLNSKLLYKYVDSSIHKMLAWFDAKAISKDKLEVKLFGGSNYFLEGNSSKSIFNVGKRNCEIALDVLITFNIKPKATDIGGKYSRKIIFNCSDGSVLLKRFSQVGFSAEE